MKVVLNTLAAGPNGIFRPGDIIEVDPKDAKALVDSGQAQTVQGYKQRQQEMERATVAAEETADAA